MIRGSAARIALCAAFIAILGLVALKAARQGLSDFYVQSASQEIERWEARSSRGNEWLRAMEYLEKSLRYAPHSAWPLEELAALHLRRVRLATQPELALASARAAYVNLREALVERPTSPFAWANLALAKLYLDEVDGELFEALGRAAELGPWEPGAQLTVVFVGLAVWHKANASQRQMIVASLQRAATRDPIKVVEMTKGFSQVDLICDKRAVTKELAAACLAATPKRR